MIKSVLPDIISLNISEDHISVNVTINEMILGFSNKQKFIKQVNPNNTLKSIDKIVEYQIDGLVESDIKHKYLVAQEA
jgi:hypothetical protein